MKNKRKSLKSDRGVRTGLLHVVVKALRNKLFSYLDSVVYSMPTC